MVNMLDITHKSKPLAQQLGRIMRRERQNLNLTMRDAAERIGSIHTRIGKIECAQRDLTVLELIHICQTTGMNQQFIMAEITRYYLDTVGE